MNTNPLFDVTDRGAHVLIALTWACALILINYIEFTNLEPLISAMGVGTFILFLVCQNIGICIANAYFQVNVEMTASGIKEYATGQPLDNAALTQQLSDLQDKLSKIQSSQIGQPPTANSPP